MAESGSHDFIAQTLQGLMNEPIGDKADDSEDPPFSFEFSARLDELNAKYTELLQRAEKFQKHLQEAPSTFNHEQSHIPADFLAALRPPPETVTWEKPFDEDVQAPGFIAKAFYPFSNATLNVIYEIYKDHAPPEELQDQLLQLLPAYVCPRWQSEDATPNADALRIVEKYPELFISKSALESLLRNHVQLYFTKSIPNITEAGHARVQEAPKSRRIMAFEETKPGDAFAKVRPEAPGILHFIVNNLRTEDLKDLWPLIIPPLLHLIDATSYRIRALAYTIAGTLFEKTASSLLQRTGLFTILWDALQNGLFALPPLTPLHQSLRLVDSSLLALRHLAALHPTNATSLRATLMKEGIMDRNFSTSEHISLTNVYLKHIQGLLHDSDLEGTKELMNRYRSRLIPIIRKKLADPFVALNKIYLCRLASTLTSIICADIDGMRTGQWDMEIIAGVGLAWVRLEQDGKGKKIENLEARRELRRVMISLRGIIGEESVGWGTIERVCNSREGVMAGLIAREDPDKGEWEEVYKKSGLNLAAAEKLENMERKGVRNDEYYKLAEGLLQSVKEV